MFEVIKLSDSSEQMIRRSDLEVNSAPCLPAKLQTAVLNICKRETTGLRDIGTTSNCVCTREPLWSETRCFFEHLTELVFVLKPDQIISTVYS